MCCFTFLWNINGSQSSVIGWLCALSSYLRAGIPPWYVTMPTRSPQPCIPLGSLNWVPALIGWGKGGNVTSAGWQVTLCDPIWHVSFRSGEACCELLYPVTYLLYLSAVIIVLCPGTPCAVDGNSVAEQRRRAVQSVELPRASSVQLVGSVHGRIWTTGNWVTSRQTQSGMLRIIVFIHVSLFKILSKYAYKY